MSISEDLRPPPDRSPAPWLYRETSPSENGPGIELLATECPACGALTFPQVTVCPQCQSLDGVSVALSTEGTLFAVTVIRVRPPDYFGPVPYALGLVELEQPIRVFSVVLADDVDALRIGTRVRLVPFDVGGEAAVTSFAFRPVTEVEHA